MTSNEKETIMELGRAHIPGNSKVNSQDCVSVSIEIVEDDRTETLERSKIIFTEKRVK